MLWWLLSHQARSNTSWPHGLQHAWLPCPSPSPRVCPSSCSLNQWQYPTISFSVSLFAFCFNLSHHQGFSNELAVRIRWPKHWSFSFSIGPSKEYSGLISFKIDWFDLLAFQGTLKSLLQHHSSKESISCSVLSLLYCPALIIHTWVRERPLPWLYGPLLARWCLCFLTHCHLEKAMATHSSALAWRIPWTEEPGGLQSMGSLRVRHDWATSLHFTLDLTYFPTENQSSSNFMAVAINCGDFRAQGEETCHCFLVFPFYFPWSDGAGCCDLCCFFFLNIELKK